MSEILFHSGPFDVNEWNILMIGLIFFLAFKGKKEALKLLDKYVAKTEINIKGKIEHKTCVFTPAFIQLIFLSKVGAQHLNVPPSRCPINT